MWHLTGRERPGKTMPLLKNNTGCEGLKAASPLMMSGLLWLLVVFEGHESESESLARLTETTTSLLPTGGFSWDDSSSSARTNREMNMVHAAGRQETNTEKKTDVPCPWMWEISSPSCSRRITTPNCRSKASLEQRRNNSTQIFTVLHWPNTFTATLKKIQS